MSRKNQLRVYAYTPAYWNRPWKSSSQIADFIDIYAALDDNKLADYRRHYPKEAETMGTFATRFEPRGIQQGEHQGEAGAVAARFERKFSLRRFRSLPPLGRAGADNRSD